MAKAITCFRSGDAVDQHREILAAPLSRDNKNAAAEQPQQTRFNHPVLDKFGTNE